ncbi:MAG: hypothetical protein HY606_03950, partial [Planctomycetes bacterium]|nr:hypothetical protein [Planctomycetota bacterium]
QTEASYYGPLNPMVGTMIISRIITAEFMCILYGIDITVCCGHTDPGDEIDFLGDEANGWCYVDAAAVPPTVEY